MIATDIEPLEILKSVHSFNDIVTMALILSIFILTTLQTGIILSQCNVVNCDPDYCNGVNCSQCLPGYYDKWGSCAKCFLSCQSCNGGYCYNCHYTACIKGAEICDYANCDREGCSKNELIRCSGCPDGFYLENNDCYRCDNMHCKCSIASGCDECLPGYHGTSNFCKECVPGKYGHICQQSCITTCENGTCDKESGACSTQCAPDQYLVDKGQCHAYPNSRCAQFKSSDNFYMWILSIGTVLYIAYFRCWIREFDQKRCTHQLHMNMKTQTCQHEQKT